MARRLGDDKNKWNKKTIDFVQKEIHYHGYVSCIVSK